MIMQSSGNPIEHYFGDYYLPNLTEAFESADEAISTEVDNYHFLFRVCKWAIENHPDEIRGLDPRLDNVNKYILYNADTQDNVATLSTIEATKLIKQGHSFFKNDSNIYVSLHK